MRTTFVLSAALLALAACSKPAPAPGSSAAPPPAPQATSFGGVDLTQPVKASGYEPGWAVTINAATIEIQGADIALDTATNPGPQVGTTAQWTSTTGTGKSLSVTLNAVPCTAASGATKPLTAVVVYGTQTLNGCASN